MIKELDTKDYKITKMEDREKETKQKLAEAEDSVKEVKQVIYFIMIFWKLSFLKWQYSFKERP